MFNHSSVWARVKAAISRATPTASEGDAHVARWIAQHAERNDAAMPAQSSPMHISDDVLRAASTPTQAQADAINAALAQAFPRTPPAALPPVFPR